MPTSRTPLVWLDTRDPTASEVGITVGDLWANTNYWDIYICVDDTPNALQWAPI